MENKFLKKGISHITINAITRFMASSLSNLVNNLSERILKIKFKNGHNDKNCEALGIKYCVCFLEQTNFVDDLIEYKSLRCNKSYQKKFDKNLKE